MKRSGRRRVASRATGLALALVAASLVVAERTHAQAAREFPAGKTITIVVPYAAGGTTDASGRFLAKGLERELKTSVQIVNKPGAASQVALTGLVNAKPDGYTLSYAVLPTVITHYLDPSRQAPYTRKSFQPVAHHWQVPAMIAVRANNAYQTLRDLVEAARANPGTVTISDSGLMTNPHLTVLLLEKAAGVKFASVHFTGGAPSVTALLGGHVTALAGGVSDAVARVQSGEFRVLGVAADQESEFLPGVPTMKAQGFDVVSVSAAGILAPAGTPREVVEILARATRKVVESDEHKSDLNRYGGIARYYLGPDEYAAFWADYEARLEPVLKEIRAK
jgi:tripartite-type tricarboxylate transporter receptor subunit TctC